MTTSHIIPHDTTPARNRALAQVAANDHAALLKREGGQSPHRPFSERFYDAANQRDRTGPTPTALYTPPVTEHAGGIVLTNQDTRIYDGDGPTMRAKVTLLVIVLAILWWRLGRPL